MWFVVVELHSKEADIMLKSQLKQSNLQQFQALEIYSSIH